MQNDKKEEEITLSSRQRKELRGLGHHLSPVVQVGREGISPELLASTGVALDDHELIKIKLGQNCPVDKKEAARLLAEGCSAALVQLIGKTVLLYRPNPDLPDEKRVNMR